MKESHKALISEVLEPLNKPDRDKAEEIIACLDGLGYTPQRLKTRDFVLAFKSYALRQMIAKIGIRNGAVFYAIKFYACKDPPQKFDAAVRNAVLRTDARYRCVDCGVCGANAGERGYRIVLPGGEEFVLCGAYVVEIPELTEGDAADFCRLLFEQNAYFQSRI